MSVWAHLQLLIPTGSVSATVQFSYCYVLNRGPWGTAVLYSYMFRFSYSYSSVTVTEAIAKHSTLSSCAAKPTMRYVNDVATWQMCAFLGIPGDLEFYFSADETYTVPLSFGQGIEVSSTLKCFYLESSSSRFWECQMGQPWVPYPGYSGKVLFWRMIVDLTWKCD